MDFSPSESQQAVQQLAARILTDLVTDESLQRLEQAGDSIHRRAWEQLGEAELLSLSIPESAGGAGVDVLAMCALWIEVGRRVAPVPVLECSAYTALPVAELASAAVQQELLAGMATGQRVATAAWAEPGSPDPRRPRCQALRTAGGWRLRGQKLAVPFAAQASWVLLSARTPDGIGLFALDPTVKGVRREDQRSTHGLACQLLHFDAPALAQVAQGSGEVESAIRWARLGTTAVLLGVVERALELTTAHVARRKQFGQPIAAFQAVAHRAADAHIDAEALRVALWQAAWQLSEGLDARRAVWIARYHASEVAHRVTAAAQHLHGGMGYDRDYPLHRTFLWARHHGTALGGGPALLAELGGWLAEQTPGGGA